MSTTVVSTSGWLFTWFDNEHSQVISAESLHEPPETAFFNNSILFDHSL
ncbi:MAG: hypothetical protein JW915_12175 [Chitinispirillaceae bacterium]|nr:hypothetical protein [Chitinispirillaceae bacterium]